MAEYKDMCLSPVRTPKLQLVVEQPSTGGHWNPQKKRYSTSKDKEEVTMRRSEGSNYDKIKSYTGHHPYGRK